MNNSFFSNKKFHSCLELLKEQFTLLPNSIKKNNCIYLALLLISAALVFFCNIYAFPETQKIITSIFPFSISVLLTFSLLLLFLKSRLAGIMLLILALIPSFVAWYIRSVFGLEINYQIIASILETTPREMTDYITLKNAALVTTLLFVFITGIIYLPKYLAQKISWSVTIASLLLLLLLSIVITHTILPRKDPEKQTVKNIMFWPLIDARLNYKRIKDYYHNGLYRYRDIMQLPSPADFPSSCLLKTQDELTIVMHIGESLRSDHLSLNGYHRTTTPNLDRRQSNLISFKQNYSYGLVTRVSLIGMMSDAEVMNRNARHRPYVDLFNHYGFETISIFSLPETLHDHPLGVLTSACKKACFSTGTGTSYLYEPTVEKFREQEHSVPNKRKLYLLYDQGAHTMFASLPHNRTFLPEKISPNAPLKNLAALNNRYDNNILEIDREIEHIISLLENKTAVYIYAADHGVALGENGQFGQSNTTEPVMKPAFFIWLSTPFITKYPDIARALKANSSKTVSHDYLYHTILSLGLIQSSIKKEELDLTRPEAKEFSPPQNREFLLKDQTGSLF